MPVSSNSGNEQAAETVIDIAAKGSHILVVDKDYELCQSIKASLKAIGLEVTVAHDGNAAIAIAEVKQPDLIVLDLQIPKRSGLLVLEHLAIASEKPIPVIVITSNQGSRHQQYAKLLGAKDYILKPFTMDRLIGGVTELLSV